MIFVYTRMGQVFKIEGAQTTWRWILRREVSGGFFLRGEWGHMKGHTSEIWLPRTSIDSVGINETSD